jgi:hypothetical protein
MKKCIVLLFLAAFSFSNSFSQSLTQYVPKTALYVIGVDWGRISEKIAVGSTTEFNQDDNQDPFAQFFINILKNPKEFGLDLTEKSFVYSDLEKGGQNVTLVVGLEDSKQFQSRCTEWLKQWDKSAVFIREGNSFVYGYQNIGVSHTSDMAILHIGRKQYYYSSPYKYNTQKRVIERAIDSMAYEDNDQYLNEDKTPDVHHYISDLPEVRAMSAESRKAQMGALLKEAEDRRREMEEAAKAADEEMEEVEEAEEAVAIVEDVAVEEAVDYEDEPIEIANNKPKYYPRTYNYQYHPLMVSFEEIWKDELEAFRAKDKIKDGVANIDQCKTYLTLEPSETQNEYPKFTEIVQKGHDMLFWVNPNSYNMTFAQMFRDFNRFGRYTKEKTAGENNEVTKLLDDNYSYAFGDFNQGSLEITTYQDRNEQLAEYEFIKTTPVNSKMLNYIKDETFGVFALNIDPESYFESYRTIMNATMDAYNVRPQYRAQFEMMDIFINKDIFYNTFKGDGVFALTGVKSKIETRFTYEYNEETFEREEVEKSDTMLVPEVLVMMSVEKMENAERLMKAMKNMKFLKPHNSVMYSIHELETRGYYRDEEESAPEFGEFTGFYIGIKDGIVFITNDETILESIQNGTGIAKSDRIAGKGLELLKEYGNTQFWNSEKSFEAVLSLGGDLRPKEKSNIQVFQKYLEDSYTTSAKEGNSIVTTTTLNFSETSMNSLNTLLDMMLELGMLD